MWRVRTVVLLLGVLAAGVNVPAQAPPEVYSGEEESRLSSGDVVFGVDLAGFRGPEGHARMEIYFQLHADQLSFLEGNFTYRATYEVNLALLRAPGDTVLQRAWGRGVEVRSEVETKDRSNAILDLFQFDAPPGSYTLTVTVTDRESGKQGIYTGPLTVPAFKGLSLSQIQFASRVDPAGKTEAFIKQGVQVDPHVTRTFDTATSKLHFYYECYGLTTAGKGPGSVSVVYSILNADNFPMKTYSKRFRTEGESFARVEELDIAGVDSAGQYTLRVQVRDDRSRKVAESRRMFKLQQPLAVQLLATDEGSLERYYNQIKYIATQEELNTYKKLSPRGKAEFILAFWKKRDPTPDTPVNEFAQEHFRRIEYANNRFVPLGGKHKQDRGMETDMGRVYIKYGPPDEIEDQLAPSATRSGGISDVGFDTDIGGSSLGDKPVQIWYYNRMGNYTFIFRDRYGLGVYELVHSDYPGERYDPDWRSRQ